MRRAIVGMMFLFFGFMVAANGWGQSYGPPQISLNGAQYTFAPSASGSNNSQGADVYQSASGAQIAITSNDAVTITRRDGSQVTGTYNPSTDQFNFGANYVGVISATNSSGQVLNTLISGGQTTEISGGLDIEGNVFTLGNWTNGAGNSVNALTLSYTDTTGSGQPSLFNFNATRASVDWIWSSAQTDGSATQLPSMMLDNGNRLILYVPANPTTTVGVVLDPVAGSGFQGPLRVLPQGDVSMGPYQNGPTPP